MLICCLLNAVDFKYFNPNITNIYWLKLQINAKVKFTLSTI